MYGDYWLGMIVPISTVLREFALAPAAFSPTLVPPMTIIVWLFSKATATKCLALVSESTFLHEFLCMSYRKISDVGTSAFGLPPPMITAGLE